MLYFKTAAVLPLLALSVDANLRVFLSNSQIALLLLNVGADQSSTRRHRRRLLHLFPLNGLR